MQPETRKKALKWGAGLAGATAAGLVLGVSVIQGVQQETPLSRKQANTLHAFVAEKARSLGWTGEPEPFDYKKHVLEANQRYAFPRDQGATAPLLVVAFPKMKGTPEERQTLNRKFLQGINDAVWTEIERRKASDSAWRGVNLNALVGIFPTQADVKASSVKETMVPSFYVWTDRPGWLARRWPNAARKIRETLEGQPRTRSNPTKE